MKTIGGTSWLVMLLLLMGCSQGQVDMKARQNELVSVYPRDTDPAVTAFVTKEFGQLLAATEHPNYPITVTLGNPHIIGPSIAAMTGPNGDITIRTSNIANAMKSETALWSLRLLIAHELGHVMHHHGFNRYTQVKKELEADRYGMEYFKRLGWPCKVWVDRFRRAAEPGYYNASPEHDQKARYEQAQQLCEGEK